MDDFSDKVENLDSETFEIVEQKSNIEGSTLEFTLAISKLESDPELSSILNISKIDLEIEKDSIEDRILEYQSEVQAIDRNIQLSIAQNEKNAHLLQELAEDGENVSGGLAITENRRKIFEKCLEKLREIFDRLEISALENSVIHEIGGTRLFSELKSEFYDDAQEVAQYSNLKFYKAHLGGHIKMVVSRSIEAAQIISKISGVSCSIKDIAIASLYHDTGMNGNYRNSKRYSPEDGDGIRKNHSLTSAVHVLEDRDKIKILGGNPDKMRLWSIYIARVAQALGFL